MSQTNDISISKQAAEKINNIISSEKKDLMLKISVLGGGCAGFSYKFDLVDNSEQGDIIIEEHGAKVIIDDLRGDGDHYAAQIIAEEFRGKTRVQQHQMVYNAMGGRMGKELHALALNTSAPKE